MVFILQLLVSDVQEAKNRKLEPEGKTFHCEIRQKTYFNMLDCNPNLASFCFTVCWLVHLWFLFQWKESLLHPASAFANYSYAFSMNGVLTLHILKSWCMPLMGGRELKHDFGHGFPPWKILQVFAENSLFSFPIILGFTDKWSCHLFYLTVGSLLLLSITVRTANCCFRVEIFEVIE